MIGEATVTVSFLCPPSLLKKLEKVRAREIKLRGFVPRSLLLRKAIVEFIEREENKEKELQQEKHRE